MGYLEQLETVALLLLGAAILLSLWMWASESIDSTKKASTEQKESAIKCSNLEVNKIYTGFNGTHTTVFFDTNVDVNLLEVRFRGNETALRNVTDVKKKTMRHVSAPVNRANVSIYAPGCIGE